VPRAGIALAASNLSKSFGGLLAVDSINFELKTGEAFGLLGPNGAGKTTTINMLIGLLSPDAGQVTLGQNGNPSRLEDRKRVGIAPQKLSLYDELTAQENLAFFGQLYGLSRHRLKQRIAWCLEFAGLADRANDRVGQYSGGMQRRLNLASALLHEPELILLDEPTVGVDPQSRHHLLASIEQLKQQGLTVLYTTHYMEEAQQLCDRVAIIDHGRILDCDQTDQLLQRHGGPCVVRGTLSQGTLSQGTLSQGTLSQGPGSAVRLPGRLEGNQLRFESEDPISDLARLKSDGWDFARIEISQPDLETAFLALTGRSLRD